MLRLEIGVNQVYPEDQTPRNYSDEEIDEYRKSHSNDLEPKTHKHAKLVLILSLLLLLFIVVGASYYLTKNKNETDYYAPQTVRQEKDATDEIEDIEPVSLSSDWLLYKSNEYDIKIPDGWNTIHQDNGVLLMSCDTAPKCYDLVKGTLATVEETIGGRDGLQGFLFVIQEGLSLSELTFDYILTRERETVNGYSLYAREITEEPDYEYIGANLPVGTTEYIAVKLLEDNRISYFSWSVTPTQNNPLDLIEEIINSLMVK